MLITEPGYFDQPGQNAGAEWYVSRSTRIRGYDMIGVKVEAPWLYRIDIHPNGFDVVHPARRFLDWVLDRKATTAVAGVSLLAGIIWGAF